jgi:hypothetical protein
MIVLVVMIRSLREAVRTDYPTIAAKLNFRAMAGKYHFGNIVDKIVLDRGRIPRKSD